MRHFQKESSSCSGNGPGRSLLITGIVANYEVLATIESARDLLDVRQVARVIFEYDSDIRRNNEHFVSSGRRHPSVLECKPGVRIWFRMRDDLDCMLLAEISFSDGFDAVCSAIIKSYQAMASENE